MEAASPATRRDPEWAYEGGRPDGLPSDLDTLPPGLGLAAVVFITDRTKVSAYDLVRLLRAEARLISALQARFYETIAEISKSFDVGDEDAGAAEIAAALHLTRGASEAEYESAERLQRHSRVRDALATGEIDIRRARVLIESTGGSIRQRLTG